MSCTLPVQYPFPPSLPLQFFCVVHALVLQKNVSYNIYSLFFACITPQLHTYADMQGRGRRYWDVYYTSPQSFIRSLISWLNNCGNFY